MFYNLSRLALCLGALLLALSCAPAQHGVPYHMEWKNAHVGRYTVQVPANNEWVIVADKEQGTLTAEKLKKWWTGKVLGSTLVKIYENQVHPEGKRGVSEQQIADDYRANEESILRAAEQRGEYVLNGISKASVVIGEKQLQTLTYKISKGSWLSGPPTVVEAVLYLYFPKDFQQTHTFYCFLISESHEKGALVDVDLDQIRPFIESFELR